MTTETEVTALAQRIALEFKTVRTEISETLGAGNGGFAVDVPAGAATASITHNLNTQNVLVFVYDKSTSPWLGVDVAVSVPDDGNTVFLEFGTAPTTGQYRAVIIAADGSNGDPIGSFAGPVPTGSTTVEVAHGLGTQDIAVFVYDTSSSPWIPVDVGVTVPTNGSTVVLDFGVTPSTGQYRLVVLAANPGGGGGGAVTSVNGSIGDVVVTPASIGASPETHSHPIGDITNLQTTLNGKASSTHTHNASDISAGTLASARLPYATATAAGAVELATTDEATAGTDTSRAVTPAGLTAAIAGVGGMVGAPTFIQATEPAVTGPAIWYQTDGSGNVISKRIQVS